MAFLAIFSALGTLYAELAKGGAKVEADKIMSVVTPVVSAAAAPAAAPLNAGTVLSAAATIYDGLATGGAKATADEVLGVVQTVLAAAPAIESALNSNTQPPGATTATA